MKANLLLSRRLLLICAAVFVIVALVLMLGVIRPVKDELARGGTTENAVLGFWINIILNFISALALFLIAIRSKGRSWISTSLLVIAALVVLLLGLALLDAASAYRGHGLPMRSATIIIFICAAADILGGFLVVITMFLRPKRA